MTNMELTTEMNVWNSTIEGEIYRNWTAVDCVLSFDVNITSGEENISSCSNLSLPISTDRSQLDSESLILSTTIIYCVVAPVLGLIGFMGNLLSLIIIGKEEKKTQTEVFLLSIGGADISFCTLTMIKSFMYCGHSQFPLFIKEISAKMTGYMVHNLLDIVSKLGKINVVLLAVCRCFVIVFPTKDAVSKKRAVGIAIVVQSIFFIYTTCHLTLEYLLFQSVFGSENTISESVGPVTFEAFAISTLSIKESALPRRLFNRIGLDIMPLILVCLSNIVLVKSLAKTSKKMAQNEARKARDAKINRTLFWITCSFILLCGPMDLFAVAQGISGGAYQPWIRVAVNVFQMLLILNHSINFIIYGLNFPKFRERFKKILGCK